MAKHPAVAACAVIASRIRSVEIRSISIRSRWVKGRPRGLSGLTAIRAGLPPRRGPGPIRRCHRLRRGPEGPPGNVEGPSEVRGGDADRDGDAEVVLGV
jgi:hypothetical protein